VLASLELLPSPEDPDARPRPDPLRRPSGWLYVPVGAPCNICEPAPDRYAAILRMSADGAKLETFARGVRNTVGFDWHPETRELWFTENGRDMLGDDVPPDELNHAPRAGLHFGYPCCHAGVLPDPEYGDRRGTPGGACKDFTAPAQPLGAHVAPLGMRFYTGTMFPAEWRGRVFIAEHGSWNRARKSGYRITTARLDGAKGVAYEPFATGWLQGESAWGRPTCWWRPTVRCWCPTTRPARSTASATAARAERPPAAHPPAASCSPGWAAPRPAGGLRVAAWPPLARSAPRRAPPCAS
jgi:hypothetical protein